MSAEGQKRENTRFHGKKQRESQQHRRKRPGQGRNLYVVLCPSLVDCSAIWWWLLFCVGECLNSLTRFFISRMVCFVVFLLSRLLFFWGKVDRHFILHCGAGVNEPSSTLQLSPVFFDSTRAIRAINLIRHPYCPIYSINRRKIHTGEEKKWVYNHTKVKTLKLNFSFFSSSPEFIASRSSWSSSSSSSLCSGCCFYSIYIFFLFLLVLVRSPPFQIYSNCLARRFSRYEFWDMAMGEELECWREKASNNWTCRSSNLSTSVPVVWCVVYDCTMREFLGIFKLIGISASLNPSRQRAREMILIY